MHDSIVAGFELNTGYFHIRKTITHLKLVGYWPVMEEIYRKLTHSSVNVPDITAIVGGY
jgi:hypothetical protein